MGKTAPTGQASKIPHSQNDVRAVKPLCKEQPRFAGKSIGMEVPIAAVYNGNLELSGIG